MFLLVYGSQEMISLVCLLLYPLHHHHNSPPAPFPIPRQGQALLAAAESLKLWVALHAELLKETLAGTTSP